MRRSGFHCQSVRLDVRAETSVVRLGNPTPDLQRSLIRQQSFLSLICLSLRDCVSHSNLTRLKNQSRSLTSFFLIAGPNLLAGRSYSNIAFFCSSSCLRTIDVTSVPGSNTNLIILTCSLLMAADVASIKGTL